jgi:hypothetical protein
LEVNFLKILENKMEHEEEIKIKQRFFVAEAT